MKIRLELDDSVANGVGALDYGFMAFQVAHQWCPHPEWYDSLDQVLEYWLSSSLRLAAGKPVVDYVFFGSPGSLVVQALADDTMQVKWFADSENITKARPDVEEIVSADVFWRALLGAFHNLPMRIWEKYELKHELGELQLLVRESQ